LVKHEVPALGKGEKPKFFYGYVVVIAGFFIMMVLWGTIYSYGVFFKPMADDFGWTRAMTSGAYSLYMVLHGALYIVTGRLTDRFGPRKVMTVCSVILGAGFLLMSQVNAIWQLYLFYGVLIGIGASGGTVPVLTTVARWFVKRRGLMTAVAATGIGVGTIIMPLIARWLISTHDWHFSYIIVGIVVSVVLVVSAQFLRRDPAQMGQLPYGGSEIEHPGLLVQAEGFSFREAIRTKPFWLFSTIMFLFGCVAQATMVHIVPHATDLGISATVAAGLMAIIGAASIGGRIGMGGAADRVGKRWVLFCIYALFLIAFLLVIPARELWALYLFAVVFGLAYGGAEALISPVVAELFGLKALGAILGATIFAATLGGTVTPLMSGYIFDVTTSYQSAFVVLAAFSVVALVLVLLLKPIRRDGLMRSL